jgi:UDP-4-amino-4,6-dideoxy-N-acetyl-beta-L-altrosamine transaminase
VIPYGRQSIDAADLAAVAEVLQSDFLTQGPAVPKFEQAIADMCGAAHGVAAANATAGLHLACMALDLGPGDLVWTSPVTFIASANCARYCGADLDFVDIDPRTYNMSVERLAAKLEAARSAGRLPKIVIPVHLAGQSCDMRAIGKLARRYDFRVIEDASHAVGASHEGDMVGACRFSDVAIFSFHPVKIITSGEGGMGLTNDPALARRMARLRTHGITRDPAEFEQTPAGAFHYEQQELGYNYRMTDIQAALGHSQAQRLPTFLKRRRALADRYDEAFADAPLTRPWQQPDSQSSWHLYVVRVPTTDRGRIYDGLRERGIGVNLHYIPVYRQPYYARMGFNPAHFPEAEAYYAEAITLPLFPAMTDAEQGEVIAFVRELMG